MFLLALVSFSFIMTFGIDGKEQVGCFGVHRRYGSCNSRERAQAQHPFGFFFLWFALLLAPFVL